MTTQNINHVKQNRTHTDMSTFFSWWSFIFCQSSGFLIWVVLCSGIYNQLGMQAFFLERFSGLFFTVHSLGLLYILFDSVVWSGRICFSDSLFLLFPDGFHCCQASRASSRLLVCYRFFFKVDAPWSSCAPGSVIFRRTCTFLTKGNTFGCSGFTVRHLVTGYGTLYCQIGFGYYRLYLLASCCALLDPLTGSHKCASGSCTSFLPGNRQFFICFHNSTSSAKLPAGISFPSRASPSVWPSSLVFDRCS